MLPIRLDEVSNALQEMFDSHLRDVRMQLILIREAIVNLRLEKPYSLKTICDALDSERLGLTSEDLQYGLHGTDTHLSAWDGSLSEYLLPIEWMARVDPTAPRYTLAEAILLLHKVRGLVASRRLPLAG